MVGINLMQEVKVLDILVEILCLGEIVVWKLAGAHNLAIWNAPVFGSPTSTTSTTIKNTITNSNNI